MRKHNKRQILAFVLSGMLLCNTISSNSFAKEDVVENTVVEESQESQENIETQESQENQEGIVIQESQEVVSTKDDMQEEPIEEAIDNNLDISATESSAKNLEEEQNSEKTEVKDLAQESFDTFDEEVSKLISLYDRNIDGDRIASRTAGPYASRRLIVKGLGKDLDFSSYGADIVLNGPDEIYILQFSTEEATKQAKRQIDQMDGVKYCEEDGYDYLEEPEVRKISDDEIDKVAQEQTSLSWGTSHINANQYAKHLEENQNEIIVAVIDTGIDLSHPFFEGRLSMDAAYNYVSASTDVQDDHGHGTHVSGIVVDTTPGLNIKILPIKCMDFKGNGTYTNIANGIRRAADAGAKVINYSAVGGHSEYKHDAINYAIEKGITVVVSSGNQGQLIDTTCPSHMEECIVVGSIDSSEVLNEDSNYGDELDLVAPGVDIKSAYPDGRYIFLSGTSMAAPHVSGAAAMLKLNDPSLTPFQIEEILKNNAKDLGDAGRDIYYGYGMVDLSKLIVHKIVKDEAIEPTCTEVGLTEGSHCDICDMVFAKQEEIPKLEHHYEEKIKKATPTQNGEKQQVCGQCGAIRESEVIYYPKTVTLSQTEYTYTGMPKKPTATVIDSAGNIIDSSNYTISYEKGRIEVGTYTVTIKFKGDFYSGSVPRQIHINKAQQKFSGGGCTKRIGDGAFTLTSVKRTKGDGALSYKSSNTKVATISSTGKITIKSVGKTTITITAAETDSYKKATKQVTVTVKPVAMSMNSLKSEKKGSFTAYWTANKAITAYQLQYSTKSDFSQATIKTVSGYTTTSKTVYQLQAGKKYYVRFRVYKTVDGVKYYSLWSGTKTVTTKAK